jgi:hypothetical protein
MYWLLHPAEYTDRGRQRRDYWWLRDFVVDVIVRLLIVAVPILVVAGIVKAFAG